MTERNATHNKITSYTLYRTTEFFSMTRFKTDRLDSTASICLAATGDTRPKSDRNLTAVSAIASSSFATSLITVLTMPDSSQSALVPSAVVMTRSSWKESWPVMDMRAFGERLQITKYSAVHCNYSGTFCSRSIANSISQKWPLFKQVLLK